MNGVWLALVLALAGPPVLPPLPGETPPAEPEPEPAKPETPAARPSTPTAKPVAPPSEPAPAPAEPAPDEGSFSIPVTEEPPQPEATGPAPAPAPAPAPDPSEDPPPPRAEGPTAAPRIGEEAPGDEKPPGYIKLPPPTRPPYRGTGLFIGAGISFGVALTEQIIAHRLVKTRCIDPIGRGEFDTSEDVGDVFTGCAPGVLPALALRVHSDIGLLAAIGLATAGGITRGNHDAYRDVFDTPGQRRKVAGLRIAGISLIGAGVVSWLTTGAAAWGVVGNCGTARCVNSGRLMAFITRDISAGMVAAGGGMLGFAETYRRRHDGYTRDRALSIGPSLSLGGLGLTLSGRI